MNRYQTIGTIVGIIVVLVIFALLTDGFNGTVQGLFAFLGGILTHNNTVSY